MNKNSKYSICSVIAFAAIPFLGGITMANANPIFTDDFSGGVGNWTLDGPASMVHDSASEKFGNALHFSSSSTQYNSSFSRMYTSFDAQSLSVGETLQVSVTYHGLQHLASNNVWFVLGFMNNETDQLGYSTAIRSDSRVDTGALNNFHTIDGATRIGTADGGSAPIADRVDEGNPFSFNGNYNGEGGSSGNIDDIMHVTFSITVLNENSLQLTSNYHNIATDESFSSTVIVESDIDTFGSVFVGYQRRGGATSAASFEIGEIGVSVIPEPQHYTAMFSALVLGVLLLAKRRKV